MKQDFTITIPVTYSKGDMQISRITTDPKGVDASEVNGHPHITIIVDAAHAEVLEGIKGLINKTN